MKNFEDFKASREKMDPSTKKLSDHQWEQAYAAYRSARERVRSPGSRRRSSGASKSGRSSASVLSGEKSLKSTIRRQSAYADVRLIVDILAWVLIGAIVILKVIEIAVYASPAAAGSALLDAVIQVLLVLVFKFVLQVIIDIPDIALYRASLEDGSASKSANAVDEAQD